MIVQQGRVGPDERLLGHVLRIFGVAEKTHSHREDEALILLNQPVERVNVSSARIGNDLLFRQRIHEPGHHPSTGASVARTP